MDRRIREALAEEYRAQRERNAAEEARRREEVRARVPQAARLMDARQAMIERFCRQALTDESFVTPEAELRKANAGIRAALAAAGYPEDYLEPVARCPKCMDTGVMDGDVRRECDCYRQRALELSSAVTDGTQSFEAFDAQVFPETVPEGLTITQRKAMLLLKAGRLNADFVEGMVCPGGCVGGPSKHQAENLVLQAREDLLKRADGRKILENLKQYPMGRFSMQRDGSIPEEKPPFVSE